ncbi:MAG TPA: glucose-1-phosphate cytidylyltransferase [Anaerolineaceae bacterium]|jgi:glucose-1-phosphate cytidylyltransferase
MKVVILSGGLGTRLSEETTLKPKPMVEIGGQPILWHIMNIYAAYGYHDFTIALGYKAEVVKNYFLNYHFLRNNCTVCLKTGQVQVYDGDIEDWTIDLVDTGLQTETGGRLKRLKSFIGNQTFMLTYGDGVSNVNIHELVDFHKRHGKLATVTAVRPPARFGGLDFDGDLVSWFAEKPQVGEGWINGGFFVLEPEVLDYIECDQSWEGHPMMKLAEEGELVAYRHSDFWQCMDTLRDVRLLETLWNEQRAPWRVW